MNKRIVPIALVAIMLVAVTGCVRSTTLRTTRESDFDREEALAIHLEAFEPIYQFILDFYPKEGPRHERFQTRGDVFDYMSETLPANVARMLTGYFVGEEPDSFNVVYDVFFPTPLHSGVILADAYIERVEWPKMGRVDRYLVVIERFVEDLASIDRPRETRYVQNDAEDWQLHSISGIMVVRGAMYSPHGPRN